MSASRYWSPDYTGAVELPRRSWSAATASAPHSTASPNLSEFCDPAIEAKTKQALSRPADRPRRGERAVGGGRQGHHRRGAVVSLFVQNRLDFVSKRVGNYQFNPSVDGQLHDRPGLGAVSARRRSTATRRRRGADGRRDADARGSRPVGARAAAACCATARRWLSLVVFVVIVLACLRGAAATPTHVAETDPFRVQRVRHDDVDGKQVPVIAAERVRPRLDADRPDARAATTSSAPTRRAATSPRALLYGGRDLAARRRSSPRCSPALIATLLGLVAGFFGGWSTR